MERNSGTVSEINTQVDELQLSKFLGGKNALVAQGGGREVFLLLGFSMLLFCLILTLLMTILAPLLER